MGLPPQQGTCGQPMPIQMPDILVSSILEEGWEGGREGGPGQPMGCFLTRSRLWLATTTRSAPTSHGTAAIYDSEFPARSFSDISGSVVLLAIDLDE